MRNLIRKLKQWVWPGGTPQMPPPSPRVVQQVAQQVEMTHDVEYSCDEVLHLLDQFVEAFLRGEDVAKLMPLVKRHLEMCADCREEFEALVRVLRGSPASPA
jgi:hypothetical protein